MGRRKKSRSISTDKSCVDSNSNSTEAKSKSYIELLESQIQELQISTLSIATKQNDLHISQSQLQKLIALENLPVFHGRGGKENAVDWLTATERRFAYLNIIPEQEKVKVAATRLCGDASPWMCWYESRYPSNSSWSLFRHEFLRFFRPETLIATVCNLEQKRSVKEYEIEFLRLTAGARDLPPDWTDEQLMNLFIGGLQGHIRCKVEWFRPKTLADAMDFARNVESENA